MLFLACPPFPLAIAARGGAASSKRYRPSVLPFLINKHGTVDMPRVALYTSLFR
jgi:hypothetical protein